MPFGRAHGWNKVSGRVCDDRAMNGSRQGVGNGRREPTDHDPSADEAVETEGPAKADGRFSRAAAVRGKELLLSPRLRFAAVAVVAFALFVATYAVLVATEAGQRVENLALLGVELRASGDLSDARERMALISVVTFALAIVAVFGVGVLSRRGGLGSLAAGIMVASVVGAEVLKEFLPRPVFEPGPVWLLRNSFPSGSATVATSLAVGALLVAPDRLRWLVLPLGALYAAVVGDAVQITGWHRLSDTIGASLLVISVASAGLVVLARMGLVQPSGTGGVDRRIVNALVIAALTAFLVGAVLALLPAAFPLLGTPEGSRRAFLQVAFPFIGAGFTILAVTLFARTIEPFSLGRGERDVQPPAEEPTP